MNGCQLLKNQLKPGKPGKPSIFRQIIGCLKIKLLVFGLLFLPFTAAESRVRGLQIEKNSGSLIITIETDKKLKFGYRHLEGQRRVNVKLQGDDIYGYLSSYFASMPSSDYEPCIKNIHVDQMANGAQLLIEMERDLAPSVFRVTASEKNNHSVVINLVADPPVPSRCITALPAETEKSSVPSAWVYGFDDIAEVNIGGDLKDEKQSTAFEYSAYAMYDYVEDIGVNDTILRLSDNRELRRFRVDIKRTLGDWYYLLGSKLTDEFDSDDDVEIYRGYVGYSGWSGVKITTGLLPEPFGLEKSTSSKSNTFMERSLPIALMPDDNPGILLSILDSKSYFAEIGAYLEGDDIKSAITGRLGISPVNERARLYYMGISTSLREPKEATLRYRAYPEAHLAAKLFDSGAITNVDQVTLSNFEFAAMWGAFSIQAEHITANVEFKDSQDPRDFTSAYVYASYFLTGESRRYSNGSIGRLNPIKNIGYGMGALEVAIRYSRIEEQNQQLEDYTVGVNWYLNKQIRLMVNWVVTQYDDTKALKDELVQTRIQVKL